MTTNTLKCSCHCQQQRCHAPTSDELEEDSDYWVFYWSDAGDSTGYGTACIKESKPRIAKKAKNEK
jgi:hypothetical protein